MLFNVFNIKEQEKIRANELDDYLELDYDYIKERLCNGDNDIISIIYNSILNEVSTKYPSLNITEYIYVYGNYSDTSFQPVNYGSKDELDKLLNDIGIENLPKSLQFLLEELCLGS